MKLACASGALHREIESGELTQLEFLDICARELPCDGVVLDVRHFPRSDDDYLAQVKKMATDRGLTIAAIADSSFFAGSPDYMATVLDRALALGAPIVASPLARETQCSWSEQLARLNAATSLAKARNVRPDLCDPADRGMRVIRTPSTRTTAMLQHEVLGGRTLISPTIGRD